jgi:hypothetical protein
MREKVLRFEPKWITRRAEHRGLHGHSRIDKQRRIALLMIVSGFLRVVVWTVLLLFYLAHVAFARTLFASVAFVAVLSVLALMLTDWGQVAASLAQFSASEAHHDAEAVRKEVSFDAATIEEDIARLAQLQPCKEADELAAQIRAQIAGK